MNKVIYLDMDGVIVDFIKGLLLAHHRLDLLDRYLKNEYPVEWNMEGLLGNEAELWFPVEQKGFIFWSELDIYSWGKKIVNKIIDSGVEWYFCSKPYDSIDCYSGKYAWLDKTFPGLTRNQIIFIQHKDLLAKEGALLIDDSNNNIVDFASAGGDTLLFPRPWNSTNLNLGTWWSEFEFMLDVYSGKETYYAGQRS